MYNKIIQTYIASSAATSAARSPLWRAYRKSHIVISVGCDNFHYYPHHVIARLYSSTLYSLLYWCCRVSDCSSRVNIIKLTKIFNAQNFQIEWWVAPLCKVHAVLLQSTGFALKSSYATIEGQWKCIQYKRSSQGDDCYEQCLY